MHPCIHQVLGSTQGQFQIKRVARLDDNLNGCAIYPTSTVDEFCHELGGLATGHIRKRAHFREVRQVADDERVSAGSLAFTPCISNDGINIKDCFLCANHADTQGQDEQQHDYNSKLCPIMERFEHLGSPNKLYQKH